MSCFFIIYNCRSQRVVNMYNRFSITFNTPVEQTSYIFIIQRKRVLLQLFLFRRTLNYDLGQPHFVLCNCCNFIIFTPFSNIAHVY